MVKSYGKNHAPAIVSLRLVSILAMVFMAAGVVQAADFKVHKSVGCMCCEFWADHLRSHGHSVTITPDNKILSLKENLEIPVDLWGCHTARVEGYIIEGHVPAEDVARLLQDRPDALGLAVAGMPVGSPGMETNGPAEPYQVILFHKDGRREIYARHGG